jgi:hypothetical protein
MKMNQIIVKRSNIALNKFSTHNALRNDLVTGQVNYKGNFEDISLYIQFYS